MTKSIWSFFFIIIPWEFHYENVGAATAQAGFFMQKAVRDRSQLQSAGADG